MVNFLNVVLALPLLALWIVALVDLAQRGDPGRSRRLLWAALVLLVPYIGVFLYLLLRPRAPLDATIENSRADDLVDEVEAVLRRRNDGQTEPADARREIETLFHAATAG